MTTWDATVAAWLETFGRFHTRKSYRAHLKQFAVWHGEAYGAPPSLSTISASVCCNYRTWLLERFGRERRAGTRDFLLEKATAKTKFASVSSFLTYCANQGYIARNFASAAPRIRAESRPREALTVDQMRALLAEPFRWMTEERPEAPEGSLVRLRQDRDHHRAYVAQQALTILCFTGCRVGELVTLRQGDLLRGPQGWRLRFLAKGGKVHMPLIGPDVELAFRRACRLSGARKPDDVVFRNQLGRPGNEAWINGLLTETCDRAGIPRVTCHSLRASLATALHTRGIPLIEIRNLLGHASVETTARYVRYADEVKHSAGLKIDFLG